MIGQTGMRWSLLQGFLFFLMPFIVNAQIQSQDMLPICKNYKDVFENAGKSVRVFGRLARAYTLPHQPYILLLPDNQWIFLGNEEWIKSKGEKSTYMLIEGMVKMQNPDFDLSKFSNTPAALPPQPLEKNPQDIIRSKPFFEKAISITAITVCYSQEEVKTNLGRLILVYGRYGLKKDSLYFNTSKKEPVLHFEIPRSGDFFNKKNYGFAVLQTNEMEQNILPSDVLLYDIFPKGASQQLLQKHMGKILALSGRLRKKKNKTGASFPALKLNSKTWIYLPQFQDTKKSEELMNKKVKLIGRVLQSQLFFQPATATFQPGFEFAYLDSVLWIDKK